MRANSTTSLRSDGSDSEVLNRLEHLKRQLKDKEARLQDHVDSHQTKTSTENASKSTYQPPTQAPAAQRKQSPAFLFNAARVHHHHHDLPITTDRVRQMLETDDDLDFKPNYFRDDTTLLHGTNRRRDSGDRMFKTKTEKEANRRRYGHDEQEYFDQDDPTTMANYELNVRRDDLRNGRERKSLS